MTPDQVQSIALERLQVHGHLLHSQLLLIAGGDESLMRDVSNRLIEGNLAVDESGVKLVAVPATSSATGSDPGSADGSSSAHEMPAPIGDPIQKTPRQQGADTGEILRYVLWNAGRESEPFPREELEQRLADGRLQPADFVRIDSEDEWMPASKALGRKEAAPSPPPERRPLTSERALKSDRKTSKRIEATAVESAAATTPAVAVTAAARQTPRPKSTPDVLQPPAEGMSRLRSDLNWVIQRCDKRRLRAGMTILLVVLCGWGYWNWPPAAKSISAEFQQYVSQLEGIESLHGPNPSSLAWQKFVNRTQSRITYLVTSLEPRVNAKHPADRELFYAGERGLLPMLREGLHGTAHDQFRMHLQQALQIIEGTVPAGQTLAGSAAHAGPPSSNTSNPLIRPGVTRTNPANPHDSPRPTQ